MSIDLYFKYSRVIIELPIDVGSVLLSKTKSVRKVMQIDAKGGKSGGKKGGRGGNPWSGPGKPSK
jgi:hypothetical protein